MSIGGHIVAKNRYLGHVLVAVDRALASLYDALRFSGHELCLKDLRP